MVEGEWVGWEVGREEGVIALKIKSVYL